MFDVWDQFGPKRAKMLTDEFQILSRVTLFFKKNGWFQMGPFY